jgi:hypothetical protein
MNENENLDDMYNAFSELRTFIYSVSVVEFPLRSDSARLTDVLKCKLKRKLMASEALRVEWICKRVMMRHNK